MSMHYDSESLVDRGRSPRLFALLDIYIYSMQCSAMYIHIYIYIYTPPIYIKFTEKNLALFWEMTR